MRYKNYVESNDQGLNRMRMVSSLQQYFRDQEKNQFLIRLSCLGLLAGCILYLCGGEAIGDLKIYYSYALQVTQGKLPYQDFPVEYPPLALLPILIPQGLNLITVNSFNGYEFFFYVQNVLLICAIGQIIVKISAIQQLPKTRPQVVLAYGLLVALNSPFILYRFDIFCAWLSVWSTWLILTDRPLASGAVIGLGTAAKLYPALLIPVFLIHCLAQKKFSSATRLVVGFAIVLLSLTLLFSPLGLDNVFYFLTYHRMRGLQAETLPSGLLILVHKLGWTRLDMVVNYGALHLESPASKPILQMLPLAFVLGLAVTVTSFFSRIKNRLSANPSLSSRQLTIYILAILTVFISTNKVFSPQYLVWLLPFIPLLPNRQIALFSLTSILTFLIYPIFYRFLIDEKILLIAMLNYRNYLIVVLVVRLIRRPIPRPKLELVKTEIR